MYRDVNTSRRQFVAALGAAAVAGPRVVAAAEPKEKSPVPGYIDAHVHVWTPDVAAFPTAVGWDKSTVKPDSFTPEELLAHAKPSGVGRIVLIQMSFYRFDNRYMLDAMRRFPGVFSGVAIVDHGHPYVAGRMKELAAEGVRGFRLTGWKDPEKYFAEPGIATMWRTGAETGLNMCLLINADALPIVDRLCEQYPNTPVVIDHFARIGIDGEIRETELANLCRLARHKKVTVKTSAFYALGKKQSPYTDLLPMIKRLRDEFGSERLMWATDCPFQVEGGHTYQDSVDLIAKHADFLTAKERQDLLHDTAQRVFFS
jgi:predicted TIM-barrel fold metal-dependent hydrolase